MNIESEHSSGPTLITHVQPLDVVIERTPFVVPRLQDELPLDRSVIDELMRLSWWERVTLFVDDAGKQTKLYLSLVIPFFNIYTGYKMSIKQRLIAGVIGVITALLAHFAIELPLPVNGLIDLVVTFGIGLLIPSGSPSETK